MSLAPIIVALMALFVVLLSGQKLGKSRRNALLIVVTVIMLAILVFEVISAYRQGQQAGRQEKSRTQTAK